jgi:acetyl-CoA synthetase
MTPEDVVFFPNELSFMYAWGCNFLFPLYAGASVVLWTGRFDVERCLEAIQRYRVTQFVAVPTMLRMILNLKGAESKYSLASTKWCLSGGEPLPAATYHEFKERFNVEIFDTIGQSEIHLFLGNWKGLRVKPGSMGKPFPGHQVAVVDDEGRPCKSGEIGRLAIDRADAGLATGYCKMSDLWGRRFRGSWYDTGDLAHVDEEGYYWYESRSDDLIKSRAYLISPREVEAAVMEHPAVLEVGVVGVPDDVMGQRVKAFVVVRTGHQPSEALREEIQTRCRSRIAPFKVPKEIEFVLQLPKTSTGKILRRTLRGEA